MKIMDCPAFSPTKNVAASGWVEMGGWGKGIRQLTYLAHNKNYLSLILRLKLLRVLC